MIHQLVWHGCFWPWLNSSAKMTSAVSGDLWPLFGLETILLCFSPLRDDDVVSHHSEKEDIK